MQSEISQYFFRTPYCALFNHQSTNRKFDKKNNCDPSSLAEKPLRFIDFKLIWASFNGNLYFEKNAGRRILCVNIPKLNSICWTMCPFRHFRNLMVNIRFVKVKDFGKRIKTPMCGCANHIPLFMFLNI